MKKFIVLGILCLFPYSVNAALMSPAGQKSTLEQEIFTFNGTVENSTYEWRSSHQQGSIEGFVDFVAEAELDFSLFLFSLTNRSFQNGPVVPGTSEGRRPNFSPGGVDYLGDLIAYDQVSDQNPQDDQSPRISGYLDGTAFSIFVAPLGTTEQMIRTNNQNAMLGLVNQQAMAQGIIESESQSIFRRTYGQFALQATVPAFCCFGPRLFSSSNIGRQTLNSMPPNVPVSEPSLLLLFLFASFGFMAINRSNMR